MFEDRISALLMKWREAKERRATQGPWLARLGEGQGGEGQFWREGMERPVWGP